MRWFWIVIFGVMVSCAAPIEQDGCVTATDGVCDELTLCPLGTDATDCLATCDQNVSEWPLVGVCAHYEAREQGETAPALDDADPSDGEGGLAGTWDGTVTVRGANVSTEVVRHYRVYAPRKLRSDKAVPVVFALGGFTVDMYWLAEFTELNRMADREGFIVVYGQPEWRYFGSDYVFAWYVYNQAWQGDWPDNPDIAYMESVLDVVASLYNVDFSRVYVSGHSRGAALSVIAAVERPDLFAGFGAHAGFGSVNNYNERIRNIGADLDVQGVLVHGDADPDVNVSESDQLEAALMDAGWDDSLLYYRIPNATHEWQSHLNQDMFDFWLKRVQP